MGEGYKIRDQFGIHHLTMTILDWLHIFKDEHCCDIFIDALRYSQEHKDLAVHAYVIMPSHVHLLASSDDGKLSKIIGELKRYTSGKIKKYLEKQPSEYSRKFMPTFKMSGTRNSNNTDYQMWMQRNHPIHLYSHEFIMKRVYYIHLNPVKAGLVDQAQDYKYSSALAYSGGESPVEITFIKQKTKYFSE